MKINEKSKKKLLREEIWNLRFGRYSGGAVYDIHISLSSGREDETSNLVLLSIVRKKKIKCLYREGKG